MEQADRQQCELIEELEELEPSSEKFEEKISEGLDPKSNSFNFAVEDVSGVDQARSKVTRRLGF